VVSFGFEKACGSIGSTAGAVSSLAGFELVTLCALLGDRDVFIGPATVVILDDLSLAADADADADGDDDVAAIVLLVVTAGEEDADTRSDFDIAEEQCSVVPDPLAVPITVSIIVLRAISGRTESDSTFVVVMKQLSA